MSESADSFGGPQIVHICSPVEGPSHKKAHFIANEDVSDLLLMVIELHFVHPGVRRRTRFD